MASRADELQAQFGGQPKASGVTYERLPEGYRIYDGELLIGVITTKHHLSETNQGEHQLGAEDVKNLKAGAVIWTPMQACEWSIHFCSPTMSLDLLRQVASSLPAEA